MACNYSKSKLFLQENDKFIRFLDRIQYTCGDTFYDLAIFIDIQDSNDANDSMKKLFSIVKVNNILICNSPIKVS